MSRSARGAVYYVTVHKPFAGREMGEIRTNRLVFVFVEVEMAAVFGIRENVARFG